MSKDRDPLSKALSALAWMIDNSADAVGVRELAAALNVSPSNAHRILNALSDVGYVQQDESTARYSLGLEFYRLCNQVSARMPIRLTALRHMRALSAETGETVLLGLLDRAHQNMMFAAAVDSPHVLRYVIQLNTWLPLHSGASGLAILAFLTDEEIEVVIHRSGLAQLTPHTITNEAALLRQIRTIRKQGYALSRGQRIPGAVGIAAPIFGADGRVVGDICITVPEQRVGKDTVARIVPNLLKCASDASADLGWTRPADSKPLAARRTS